MLILPRSPSAKRFRVVEESTTLMALVSQVRNHAPPVQSYSGQAPGPPGRNSAPSNRGGLQAGKRSWRLQPNGKSPTRIVPHQVENAYLYVQWVPDGRHAGAAIQDMRHGKLHPLCTPRQPLPWCLSVSSPTFSERIRRSSGGNESTWTMDLEDPSQQQTGANTQSASSPPSRTTTIQTDYWFS